MIQQLDDLNFDIFIKQNDNILLEFTATWCQPCESFKKVMCKVEEKYTNFAFASVDTDICQSIAEEFQVKTVPSIMIIYRRVMVYAKSGALTESELIALLNQVQNTKST